MPVTDPAEDAKQARRARRQRWLLLGVLNTLVLGTAVVGAVDLRRLQTPGGTALRWVQAAVFGDCDDYLRFSVPDPDPSTSDPRTTDQLCQDLRAATRPARAAQLTIGLSLDGVREQRGSAVARLTVTRQGEAAPVTVSLVRRAGDWRVVRDEQTCGSAGCA